MFDLFIGCFFIYEFTTQPCLQGRCYFAYKGVTDFNSLISKNVSKMYLGKMSNLNDLWSKYKVKNYGICHLLIRYFLHEFCMRELPYKRNSTSLTSKVMQYKGKK
ncbi:Hypothetical_protein [Hexamita inflata]|uniref:Hypothetical_protein n=1 Tax=Hexamita inflata TaxID=28002 RepID=A0AA86Q2S4_9EUKA|nr:Hypothetical protein HINF_LOCUS37783 [Hexamita inflata]